MADQLTTLAEAARKLSLDERTELAEILLQDIDCERTNVDPEWLTELHRRLEAVKSGREMTFDADDVLAELRGK